MRFRRRFYIAAAVLLVGLFSASWFVGGKLTAPAQRPVPRPLSTPLPLREVTLSSDSTDRIATWVATRYTAHGTVVLLHPIRANRLAMLSRAELFWEWGWNVVAIDLHAHGESSGDNITFGAKEAADVTAAVDYAKQLQPGGKVVVVGWSLGGAAALLADSLDVDGLVLESVYSTLTQATYNRVEQRLGRAATIVSPLLLTQLPLRLGLWPSDLEPIERLSSIDCPVLIMAGEKDKHTTIEETHRIFAAANDPKKLVVFPNAAHVDLLSTDRERYTAEVSDWLRDACGCVTEPGEVE